MLTSGQKPFKQRRKAIGHGKTADCSGNTKRERLQQGAANDPRTAGAKRDADGVLALTAKLPDDENTGHAGRDHHRQKRQSPHQQVQHASELLSQRKRTLLDGNQFRSALRVGVAASLLLPLEEGCELLLRLCERSTLLESDEDREVPLRRRIGQRLIREKRLRRDRQSDIRAVIEGRAIELLRHHADDGGTLFS